jgi:SAM-dependent methyltransferase
LNSEQYRGSERERERAGNLLQILPKGRHSVLDVGARDGYFSRLLTDYFTEVTALDLEKPAFEIPGVATVAGDATRLQFADNSFDCVFCAEVLEHIPKVELACKELARVARHELVIGVPYRQDTRVGRTTCRSCGKPNPPWGHVNRFTEERLGKLFSGLRTISMSLVGTNREATNAIAAWLMDLGGNPWGTYHQDEPCIHCGSALRPPEHRSLPRRICSALGARINRFQSIFVSPHANWIHMVFAKPGAG